MGNIRTIAVEIPFVNTNTRIKAVTGCVMKENKLYLYSAQGILLNPMEYEKYIGIVKHAAHEGRFEWCDIEIDEGQILARDYDDNILADGKIKKPFSTLDKTPGEKSADKSFSNTTLKLFNEFLKLCNKENKDMVEALDISFNDGFFRNEVEEIVSNDEVSDLNNYDKELIIRCRIEGAKYIVSNVKELLALDKHDKYIDVNYFFRRIFNLEKTNYIYFE